MSRHLPILIFTGLLCFGFGQPASGAVYDPVSMDPQDPDPAFPPAFHELLIPGHGVLMSGTEDSDVPPNVQARIVAAYEKIPEINLKAELIPGDHAFSVSRIRLQRMVIEWMDGNCR